MNRFFLQITVVICILLPSPPTIAAASAAGSSMESQPAAYSLPGIDRIWVVDDGVKVLRDNMNHSAAGGAQNPVWDGHNISLFGARNEIVAFQVILQGDNAGSDKVNLEVSDLLNGEARIPGSAHSPEDPYDYLGRYVDLYTEHYIEVTQRSTGGNAWTSLARPLTSYLGWVPDALIPFSVSRKMGGAPFRVEAQQNQAVWVDLYIPRSTTPGTYSGQITISTGGDETKIPLELQVYGFTLPDETHLDNMFGLAPASLVRRFDIQVDSAEYYEYEARFHQMAHRHRFDLVRDVFSLNKMDEFHILYLNGSLYTPAFGYDGPGSGVGNTTFSIGLYGAVPLEYGGSFQAASQEEWWAGSDAWAQWFLENAPDVAINKYLFPDEPETSGDFRKIRKQSDWTHSNPGIGSTIPTYVTLPVTEKLIEYVDFWSTAGAFTHPGLSPGTDPELLQQELEDGKQFAFYNGYRPLSGTQVLDADAIEFRVIPWIAWKYDVDQYFYWMTTYWTQWANSGKDTNVFQQAQTMEYQRMGAGTFFYPGTDVLFPSQDRGLEGPLPSIRMKNWRRGMQDYEYLYLATSLGLEGEVDKLVDQLVPAALWEADLNHNIPWPDTGYGFEVIRRQLAELIESATDSESLIIETIEDHEEALFTAAEEGQITMEAGNSESETDSESTVDSVFSDIPEEHSQRAQIESLVTQGYLTACDYSSNRFCPDEAVSLVDMAVYTLRVQNEPEYLPPIRDSFLMENLTSGTWGAYWLEQYYREGYLNSMLQHLTFKDPADGILHMEAASLLLSMFHGPDYEPPAAEIQIADIPEDAWYRDALTAAYQQGLISACLEKDMVTLCPEKELTRAEMAAALSQILEARPALDSGE
ncbi:MAG: DUF4091 domain-containing protein [Anaerolineales bacterium]|nr:DUF4091 domain-containing protein [Anaerolineales bacterium]